MSEMLANHYFLIRNFSSAKSIYEKFLGSDLVDKSIKKKLIICYITTGEVDKAISLFLSQIKEDIDFIINTDIEADDCPCPEIISHIENQEKLFKTEFEKIVSLGMLWLYCSLEKSSEIFKSAEIKYPEDGQIKEINTILLSRLKSNKSQLIN